MLFLLSSKQQQVDMHRKLAFFGEVHLKQISLFESKDINGDVILLLKVWDLTDRYRTLNTIQADHVAKVLVLSTELIM